MKARSEKRGSGLSVMLAASGRRPNEAGMASIIITLITMIVISLIVLGFATISRREQRLTLDQQLSAQAFYAAESGVEDAKKVIQTALEAGQRPNNKDRCEVNNAGSAYLYPTGGETVLDVENDVSYPCLKVDTSPTFVTYDGIGENGVVVPIKTDEPITHIEVSWQPTAPPTGNPSACPSDTSEEFTPQPDWVCGYGVARTDLISTQGALTRNGLAGDTMTAFFVPTRSGGNGELAYAVANRGKPNVVAADCETGRYERCVATFTGLGSSQEFSLRISSIYRSSKITVTAYRGSAALRLTGAQAVIDATGKAQDVLRRIQVRLPLTATDSQPIPNHALQSSSAICKRFQLNRKYFNIPGDIRNPDLTNEMCKPRSDGTPPPAGGSGAIGPFRGPSLAGRPVLFVGDYEPGNFSQWNTCQSVVRNSSCAGYDGSHYSMQTVTGGQQRQGNHAARFEVRNGDVPSFGGGERSEVSGNGLAAAEVREGDERWYQFSLKFDQNFPNPTGSWFIVMQWHSGSGSPPLALEVSRTGILTLQNNRGESPPRAIGPIKRGQWVDYTIHAKFSSNSSIGFIEAWENDTQVVPRTSFKTMASATNYLKMGIYRDQADAQTHVVYQDGLVVMGP